MRETAEELFWRLVREGYSYEQASSRERQRREEERRSEQEARR